MCQTGRHISRGIDRNAVAPGVTTGQFFALEPVKRIASVGAKISRRHQLGLQDGFECLCRRRPFKLESRIGAAKPIYVPVVGADHRGQIIGTGKLYDFQNVGPIQRADDTGKMFWAAEFLQQLNSLQDQRQLIGAANLPVT